MPGFLRNLFRADFMPHGYCFAWRPEILWLSVIADGMITLAYVSIPLTLVYFVRHRKDLAFNWIFYMFGAFILLCGATHAMGIYVLWVPIYRAEVLLKLATGLVSILTAVMLVKLVPNALRYPSPSDMEEANASLAALNLALEKKVEERTSELAAARDEAVRANSAKSDFLATMSHEIRTPLNGIIGNLDYLVESGLATSEREIYETIRLSGDALLAVISDILDFSKIEAGRLELESASFDPRRTVGEAIELSMRAAAGKGLALGFFIADEVPKTVLGDSNRLRQILLNLLSNAIKFTATGRIDCCLMLLNREKDRVSLQFDVTDTGIGIPAAVQQNLFQSFVQADSSTTRRFGGTGLGLAISKHLAEKMGGTIGVQSVEGEGARFWFTVQLAENDTPDSVTGPHSRWARPPRILLAEDNPVNQKVAIHMVESLGCSVSVVSDGHAAVEARRTEDFDAILMDCHMPLLDGFQATEAIRKWEKETGRAAIPIIALTADAMPEAEAACVAAGMNGFLLKPIEIPRLMSLLGRLLPANF